MRFRLRLRWLLVVAPVLIACKSKIGREKTGPPDSPAVAEVDNTQRPRPTAGALLGHSGNRSPVAAAAAAALVAVLETGPEAEAEVVAEVELALVPCHPGADRQVAKDGSREADHTWAEPQYAFAEVQYH